MAASMDPRPAAAATVSAAVRCPYCGKRLADDLIGRVTIACRGCKRRLRIEQDRDGDPRFVIIAETT